jgi:predicted amidohydrolase
LTFRAAVVQPRTHFGAGAKETNLANAHGHALEASRLGAEIVCFPETYPGTWRMPISWVPRAELQTIAREAGIYLVGGYAEPLDRDGVRCYNALALLAPDGREIGVYHRTTPGHAPWIYRGGEFWDFEWVAANELPVFETDLGTIGLLVCSEVYAPELARVLALKGAEMIFMPAGLMGSTTSLTETWRTLIWARAIENLVYTAVCSNVVSDGEQGLAMICSPEEVVLESRAQGVHIAPIDLERVRWLRGETDRLIKEPEPWRTKPGTLRDWRRKAVFEANPILIDEGSPALDATAHVR